MTCSSLLSCEPDHDGPSREGINCPIKVNRSPVCAPTVMSSRKVPTSQNAGAIRQSTVKAIGSPPLSLLGGLDRILDGLEGRELDVVELAVLLLDLADIDVLDDVAGVRIDRDRTARAFPFHPFHGGDQPVAVGLSAGLFQP